VALSRLNSTKAKTDNEKQRKELKRDILSLSPDLFKVKRINKSAYGKMFVLLFSQLQMNALEDVHNASIEIKNLEDLIVYKKDFKKLKKEEKKNAKLKRGKKIKKLSISWIVQKPNINVPMPYLWTGYLRGVKFFPVLPRNSDSEQTFVRNRAWFWCTLCETSDSDRAAPSLSMRLGVQLRVENRDRGDTIERAALAAKDVDRCLPKRETDP
jgi:hypothetical protein